MNFQDENEGIEFLINDFKNKIRRKETLIFYDIDEWIDIIDFLSIEEFLPFFLDKAITLSLKQHPNNQELIVRKADFISVTDYKEALKYLLDSKKKFKDTDSLTLLAYQGAKILAAQSKHKEAIKTAEECLKHKENEYILTLIGQEYEKIFDITEAEHYLIKALYFCYKKYTQNSNIETIGYGAKDFTCAGTVIPDNLLHIIGNLCRLDSDLKKVFYPIIEQFVEYDPQNTCYWEMLAEFYERCNDYEKAIDACDYFLCLIPDDLDMIRRKYLDYLESGKKKDRIKILRKILEILENKLQNKNISHQVRQDFIKNYGATYKEIISVYTEENQVVKCIEICKEVLDKNLVIPLFLEEIGFTKSFIYHTLSRLYLELGNFALAENCALKTLEIEPENYSLKIAYSELLCIIGKTKEAVELFNEIYESLEEEIADIKSKREPDEFILENIYSSLSLLFITWAKHNFLEKQSDIALNFLKLLLDELLTVECLENSTYQAIVTYIEISTAAEYPNDEIKEIIEQAVDIYGLNFLEDLMELPALEKNEKLKLFLEDIHEEFDYDEEFD